MKRLFYLSCVALALFSAVALNAFVSPMKTKTDKSDDSGRTLAKEWKRYEDAVSKDRPKLQMEILSGIKETASKKRLAWDFWEAASKYVSAGQSINWKDRGELRKALAEEVAAYDDPVMSFTHALIYVSYDEARRVIRREKERLLSQSTPSFWKSQNYPEAFIQDYLTNDYEYALWILLGSSYYSAYSDLNEYLGDSYPSGAYLEYMEASRKSSYRGDSRTSPRIEALEAFVQKYSPRAISFYGRRELLSEEKTTLDRDKSGEDGYKALMEKCLEFESDKKKLSRTEARIASGSDVDYLKETLQEKNLWVAVKGNDLLVTLQNLSSADVELAQKWDGGRKFNFKAVNTRNSFYVRDTVTIALPPMDDGDYEVLVSNGKIRANATFGRYTISLATRRIKDGHGFYAAEYKSGKPLGKVDLEVRKSGRAEARVRDVVLSPGFTPLPEALAGVIAGSSSRYELLVSYTDDSGLVRKSRPLSLYSYSYWDEPKESDKANLYLDRGAFNPGDTLHFKGIFFRGDLVNSVTVFPEGRDVEARLYDSEDKEIDKIALKTNSFGSVAGDFPIPEGLRGGDFSMALYYGGKRLAMTWFNVDEFILPTFDLAFDPAEKLFLPGDVAEVTGTITSYSGHPMTSAELEYFAEFEGNLLASGTAGIESDGSFKISFPTLKDQDWQYIRVAARVSDSTGETLEFHTMVLVMSDIYVSAELENRLDATLYLVGEESQPYYSRWGYRPTGKGVVAGDKAVFILRTGSRSVRQVPVDVEYSLCGEDGTVFESGSCESGSRVEFDLSRYVSGLYKLKTSAEIKNPNTGRSSYSESVYSFIRIDDSATCVDSPVERFVAFTPETVATGEEFGVRIGTASAPLWAIAELYGKDRELLGSKTLYLDGARGGDGSLENIGFVYEERYPDAVCLKVFWFRDGNSYTDERTFRRERTTLDLPLEFESFEDKTVPGREYTFRLKTLPGAEILAAVYDKSSDRINPNTWNTVRLYQFNIEDVGISSVNGSEEDAYGYPVVYEKNLGLTGRRRSKAMSDEMVLMEMASEPVPMAFNAAVETMDDTEESFDGLDAPMDQDVAIREDFSTTVCFEPFLQSGDDGKAQLKFRTSDKLSTFVVSVYAHTRAMQNALLRRETVVSLPVKVSVAEPQYLYCGDTYTLSVSLSSLSEEASSGTLSLYQYDTEDYNNAKPVVVSSKKVRIDPGEDKAVAFDVKVPATPGTLGMKVVYAGGDFSDGIFVAVPVHESKQVLTEAHSGVLLPGVDKAKLLESIRKSFVNVSAYGATYKEITVLDMVRDAIPDGIEPKASDVLSLSEAWYMRLLSARLLGKDVPTDGLLERILSCRNADGGFGWFEGMNSSPVLTAVLLERFAKIADAGFDVPVDLDNSVKFLDQSHFDKDWPYWFGGLSNDQYMYVRSMYADVPFDVKGSGVASVFDKRISDFKKYAKEYLVPEEERGLNSYILAKARRLLTLDNLVASEEGVALAKAWGLTLRTEKKMRESLADDVLSLLEYAVDHKDGGMYYPNAVMPFRGLLESEAYAHSLLCNLMSSAAISSDVSDADKATALKIADGIRIWLMLQKETQKWDAEPAYVDAICSVLEGSDEVLDVEVLVMSKTYEKPFSDIKAAGNGFKITRRFYRERSEDGQAVREEIRLGAALKVGDKITVVYDIWNGENRSFVRLTAPREAALRPVEQLSGYHGGWSYRPFGSGSFGYSPMGYREVKADRTLYFFDSYPEESSTVSEEFFVVREGTFSAPVVEIESLYAPHYRANGEFPGKMNVKQ